MRDNSSYKLRDEDYTFFKTHFLRKYMATITRMVIAMTSRIATTAPTAAPTTLGAASAEIEGESAQPLETKVDAPDSYYSDFELDCTCVYLFQQL